MPYHLLAPVSGGYELTCRTVPMTTDTAPPPAPPAPPQRPPATPRQPPLGNRQKADTCVYIRITTRPPFEERRSSLLRLPSSECVPFASDVAREIDLAAFELGVKLRRPFSDTEGGCDGLGMQVRAHGSA